ncbi:MAG: SMP-30/gluconolactonase/LRE family protein [Gammaproteobacteria bacterium]|nr:SMP-30/gluconolactonase/LRE family protein [Gammaproteobacteria bacterium]
MKVPAGRYIASHGPSLAGDWSLQRLTPPSRLFGANGLRTGPDGRIYVAQVSGSQISAIDIHTGAVEAISPKGGDIVAPDDLVFDPAGNLYATEITEGRVSVREPNGHTRVVCGDMPCANPIAFHQGRLFAGECRVGGRIMELDLNGGPPRVLLENVPMPNAMEVGPDGMLYFPVMGANEIWRVALGGGAPEKVAGDLGVPDAVKFDAGGFIVSTQVASGQVLRIDPRTGERTVLAQIAPGLDNLTFVGDRLFVSSISGQINEIVGPGQVRSLLPDGFNWPLDLAMGEDGVLFIADGPYSYTLRPGGTPQVAGMLFTPGCPGYIRGAAASGPGEVIVTTANGMVARYRPASQQSEELASGFDQLYGVAHIPAGAVIFAELGTGRVLSVDSGRVEVLATGLRQPMGVAICPDGNCLVSESGAGRVVRLVPGGTETVLDGLQQPQGILARGDLLYVVDALAQEVVEFNLASGARRTIASGLAIGAPPGVIPKALGAIGDMSGPMGPFAGITAGSDGTLYLSADAEGSILALRPLTGNN